MADKAPLSVCHGAPPPSPSASDSERVTVAISAIPNTGKTTLFNRLTGASQTVGNWPGVTVEKRSGHFQLDEFPVQLVDLPGAYSLSPTSLEEGVVRDYLVSSPPDLILNVVDAGNLYRGLGLTLQLARTGIPMVLAVNMMDEARRQGLKIDIAALSEHLGIPSVPVVARSGEGIAQLAQAMAETVRGEHRPHEPHISLPPIVEDAIADLARRIEAHHGDNGLDDQFLAVRLLEGGGAAAEVVQRVPALEDLVEHANHCRARVEQALGEEVPDTCARCRFNAVRGLVREVTDRPVDPPTPLTRHLDDVFLNPWLGVPLFLLIMYLTFQGIFNLGAPLQDLVGGWMAALQGLVRGGMEGLALPGLVVAFTVDGVLEGLGVVVSFFPIIALFFIFLSIIEDTGYLSRAAFIMDRLMHALGLDGKAFISILLGFGCNVPAVMGTRILSSQHSRVLSMLLIPFALCTARLQVFLFLSSILFLPATAGKVVFGLYLASFAAVILVGLALRPFRIGGRPEPFILELPPYRVPVARAVLLRAWQEVRAFLVRAGSLIVLGVIAVWFLTNFPTDVPAGSAGTLAGQLGTRLSFIFAPLGIHWQETVSLLFGFIAKEIVVGSMAVIYGASQTELPAQVATHISPLRGISFMVFTLLYTPCVATIAAIRTESRSWRVMGLSILLGLVTAWLAAFGVYRLGLALGYA